MRQVMEVVGERVRVGLRLVVVVHARELLPAAVVAPDLNQALRTSSTAAHPPRTRAFRTVLYCIVLYCTNARAEHDKQVSSEQ